MPKIFEVDAATGEGIVREMTDEEITALEIDAKRFEDQAKADKEAADAAQILKNAILEKLGITSEEAAAILS